MTSQAKLKKNNNTKRERGREEEKQLLERRKKKYKIFYLQRVNKYTYLKKKKK